MPPLARKSTTQRLSNSGQDLRFVDSNDSTLLDHEIEYWNESGTSYVWVKIPQLDATDTDFIYMYYDNSGASAPSAASEEATWSNSFEFVYHLHNSNFADASGIKSAASNNGTANQNAGVAAGARTFDGSNDYINTNWTPDYSSSQDFTWEGWFRTDNTIQGTDDIMGIEDRFLGAGDDSEIRFAIREGDTGSGNPVDQWDVLLWTNSAKTYSNSSALTPSTNVWHHAVLVRDGSTARTYLDGTQVHFGPVNTGALTFPTRAPWTTTNRLLIGAQWNTDSSDAGTRNWYEGELDEIRTSFGVARSADWVDATYDNINGCGSFSSFTGETMPVGFSSFYRSIGTRDDYGTAGPEGGSTQVTVTNGSPVVTGVGGTTWEANNRGRGDLITIDGSENYTILLMVSETELILANPYMGTNGTKNYLIERKFQTLTAWEDCIDGPITTLPYCHDVSSSSLIDDNRAEVGIAYEDTTFALSADVRISGSITDFDHTITLTADGGNRHYGVAGAGVILDGQNAQNSLVVEDDNVTVEWLEYIRVRNGNGIGVMQVGRSGTSGGPTHNVLLQNLLIHDFFDADEEVRGIRLSGDGGKTVTIRNCMIWDGDHRGIEGDHATDTLIIENCSIDNMAQGDGEGIVTRSSTVTVKNTIATSNPGGGFTGSGFSAASTNNTSSNGTIPGANSQTAFATDLFEVPNSNLHLKSGAVAIDTAVDLSASFAYDIDGGGRPSGLSWDRGADEFGAPTPVGFASFYRSIGTRDDYGTAGPEGGSTQVTVTNGSSVVTGVGGTTWEANNRGRGDRITIDATNYTILSVDSETEITLTAPFSGTTGSKDYAISRKFTTLWDWFECVDSTTACEGVSSSDLTAATDNRKEIGIAYADSIFTDGVDIQGVTTDASHNITLTADPGNRHYGIPGAGVVIDGLTTPCPNQCNIDITSDWIVVEWLEVTRTEAEGIAAVRVRDLQSNVTLNYLLIHDINGQRGIDLSGTAPITLTIRNSIIYNILGGKDGIDVGSGGGSNVTVENCTVIASSNRGITDGGDTDLTIRNTISMGTTGGVTTSTYLGAARKRKPSPATLPPLITVA